MKRNFAVIEDGKGRVLRVVEKPRYVENQIKGCGLHIFDQRVFDAIRRTPRTAMRDEYEITESIQLMINDGYRVHHRPAVEDDINLTYPTDLLRINLIELARRGLENVIGRDVTMADGTVVENSVIGDQVVITHAIRIRNSVIFPRTTPDMISLGVPGYTSTQGYRVLQRKGLDLDPSVIVFSFNFNDRRYLTRGEQPDDVGQFAGQYWALFHTPSSAFSCTGS